MARTSLMTSIFFSPTDTSTTVNSSFSSAGAAAAAGAAIIAMGAAADTPNFSSSSFTNSAACRSVRFSRNSTTCSFVTLAIFLASDNLSIQ
jgi:hypothetical protein